MAWHLKEQSPLQREQSRIKIIAVFEAYKDGKPVDWDMQLYQGYKFEKPDKTIKEFMAWVESCIEEVDNYDSITLKLYDEYANMSVVEESFLEGDFRERFLKSARNKF